VEAFKWFSKEELFKAPKDTPKIFLFSVKETAEYYFNHAHKS